MNKLVRAWIMGSKRSLSQWKLLTSVVLGVILACTIISSSSIYLDSLEEIALNLAIDGDTAQEHDLILQAKAGPVSQSQNSLLNKTVSDALFSEIGNLEKNRFTAIKSSTFFVTNPESKGNFGGNRNRGYFVSLPSINNHINIISGTDSQVLQYHQDKTVFFTALIPHEAADLFQLNVGDTIVASPTDKDLYENVVVEISGIFERNDSGQNIWYLEEEILEASTGSLFTTIPFYISESIFLNDLGPSFGKLEGNYIWYIDVNTGIISATKTTEIRTRFQRLREHLTPALPSYSQKTSLKQYFKNTTGD